MHTCRCSPAVQGFGSSDCCADGLPGKVEVKAEPRAEQNAMTLKMEEAALAETAGGVPGLAMDDKFSKKRPLPPPPPRAAPGSALLGLGFRTLYLHKQPSGTLS